MDKNELPWKLDNVAWLRQLADTHFDPNTIQRCTSSADEIERLREALEKVTKTTPETEPVSGEWWHVLIARKALKGDEK